MIAPQSGKLEIPRQTSLLVASAGLCCSLGYHLDAAVCAMRANMDHFQESAFYSLSSEPINVAMLPDAVHGLERSRRWIEFAVRDCLSRVAELENVLDLRKTALVIVGPDEWRRYIESEELIDLVRSVVKQLLGEVSPRAEENQPAASQSFALISEGRTGLATGLLQAAKYLVDGTTEQVLLIGVDGYLNAADITYYLNEDRLIVPENSNGFIPGEGAAALLLRPAVQNAPGLHVKGVGIAHEPGRHDGTVPSRGQGLTTAIRTACLQAKVDPLELEYRLSDQNGEQFFARDAANALTRVMYGGHKIPHLTSADKLGEIGGATGPAILAWMFRDLDDPQHAPGKTGLIHLSNDDGTRCAVVLSYYGSR